MIEVEFFGVCRQRTGVANVSLPCGEDGKTLAEVLRALSKKYPEFAAHCLDGDSLQTGYIANINGDKFVREGCEQIQDRENILLMSADAGG